MTLFIAGATLSPEIRTSGAQASGDNGQISDTAMQQMQALEDEKESRTPALRKIGSQLLYAARMRRGEAIAPGIQTMDVSVGANDEGQVKVDISADVDDQLLDALKGMKVEVLSVHPQYHRLSAKLSLDQLESVASLSQVRFIRPMPHAMTRQAASSDAAHAIARTSLFPTPQERAERVRQALAGLFGAPHADIIPNGYNGVGAANAEGVIAHGVYSARGTFNTDGTGIRIGVLSDGADSFAASQASGDLPPTCSSPVLPPASEHCMNIVDNTAGGDEGTAMMEVIHDLAPGAQLYFATAFTSPESFAQNIRDLRTIYGCDIIVDDVGYSNETPFQDGQGPLVVSPCNCGVIAQAVNDVAAAGALYFSSAGNSGNKNDGTSGTWEGDFVNGGASASPLPAGNLHQFTAGQNYDRLSSASPYVDLFWSDPLGGSANDYDLFVLNSTGSTILTASTDVQAGVGDPYEECYRGTDYPSNSRIVVLQKSGAANRFLHVDTNGATMTINTQGNTHGHNAASGSYGMAATAAYEPYNFAPTDIPGPYPNLFTATNQVEKYSSDGPRRYFFQGDGTAYTPGNFSATGGTLVQQPVLTASDGQEVTGAGGFPNPFYGTSCSAPTAAAIAGLIKAANPALTTTQMKTALTGAGNVDIETAGTDRDAGFGVLMAYPAMQAASLTGKAFIEFNGASVTESCCNANGLLEPGEGGKLTLNLKNTGLLNATGITTTLTSSTPSITIFNNSSAYSTLTAGGGTGSNTTDYTFKLGGNTSDVDRVARFTLTINYTNGWNPSQVINFSVPLGRQSITTTLDTTAPATSTSFPTTSTGTQTTRVSRVDPPSSCATPKTFPGATGTGSRRYDSYTLPNLSGRPACVTVTLTPDKSSTDFLESVAYLGSFNPASISTNYLADIGTSPDPGYPKSMSFTVPAGGTVVLVVNETTSSGAGTNTPYTLDVDGLPLAAGPTAATTRLSGQVVTADGAPLAGATVSLDGSNRSARTITDSAGRYSFTDLDAGQFYNVTPSRIGYSFSPATRSFSLNSDVADATFTATPQAVVYSNVVESADYFVRQHYLDFLDREPEQAGLEYWTAQIEGCRGDADCVRARRIDVSAAYFMSEEFQQTGSFVYGLYRAALGRNPRFAEFMPDRSRIGVGDRLAASKQALAAEWVTRPEFKSAYPASLSDSEFVAKLCDTAGLRGNSAERASYLQMLNSGASRAQALSAVVDSDRFKAQEYNSAFVLMEYFGYLRRDPEREGFDFWLNVLNNGDPGNYRGMVCSFLTSAEYQKRFSTIVTRSNSECGR